MIGVDKLAARQIAGVCSNSTLLAGRVFIQTQRIQSALVVQPTATLNTMHHRFLLLLYISHSFLLTKESRTFPGPHEKFSRTFSEPVNV